jgi:hypothetical protein
MSQCVAVPKSSILRCKNKAKIAGKYCGIHGNNIHKGTKIYHYDGKIVEYQNNNLDSPIIIKDSINIYLKLNEVYFKSKKIDKYFRIIKSGISSDIINSLLENNYFNNIEELLTFFDIQRRSLLKGNVLRKARIFFGICLYFDKFCIDKLINLQANIRGFLDRKNHHINYKIIKIRVKYNNNTDKILKIQKWWRYWSYLKKLPVKSKDMLHYQRNIDKIILLQRVIKNFIDYKVKRSHNCPYSGEDYWKINKNRKIVYIYLTNNNTKHWRYYDLEWLHEDFLHQSKEKRFLVEATTKEEYPDDFVLDVAKKAWHMTRIENNFLEKKENEEKKYNFCRDWEDLFSRRSLYCFTLMLYDVANMLDINYNILEPEKWRHNDMRAKYQIFFLNNANALSDIAKAYKQYNLEDNIYHITKDILAVNMIILQEENMDIISSTFIFNIYIFFNMSKNILSTGRSIFRSILKSGFEELIEEQKKIHPIIPI